MTSGDLLASVSEYVCLACVYTRVGVHVCVYRAGCSNLKMPRKKPGLSGAGWNS